MSDPIFESMVLEQLKQVREDIRDLDDRMGSNLEKIERHTRETNGRVTKLEIWRSRWEGAAGTVRWIPTFLVAVGASGVGVLVATLIVHH